MQFGISNNIYRKSGFGLHQLRNCLRGKFCSPQAAPLRGAGMLRTGGTLHFDVTLPFWITESSCSRALGGGGRCTGRAHRCKAKQGRRGKAALTSGDLTPTIVRFLDGVERVRRILW
jgi:hypothetical protein